MTLLQSTSIGLFWRKNKPHLPLNRSCLQSIIIDWKRVYLLSFCVTLETKLGEFHFKILNLSYLRMRNFFLLTWLNQINVLSAKLRLNPSSIYVFPAKYPLIFGNMFCPGCETTILLFRIQKESI